MQERDAWVAAAGSRRALALAVTTSGRSGAYEARVDTRARKNRHADGNSIKKHSIIDDFASKFNHEKIDTPKLIASKSTPKSMILRRNSATKKSTRRW